MSLEMRNYERILARSDDVLHSVHKCFDISEIGMKFHSPHAVNRGDTFTVELTALAEPLTIICRVVWCRELVSDSDDRFHFGVTFEGFTNAKQLKLKELISSRSMIN